MESGFKIIAGGLALFVLGGLSVYLITIRPDANTSITPTAPMQSAPVTEVALTTTPSTDTAASITAADSFYAAADARREQQLADKAESERLAKLKAIKERSVECKFWKQQQKTTSAAAKIDEKIDEHCKLPSSSAASESSADAPSSTSESSTAVAQPITVRLKINRRDSGFTLAA